MRCFNAIFEMAARVVVDVVPVRPEDEVPSLRAGALSRVWVDKAPLTGSRRLKSGWFGFPAGGSQSRAHTFCDLDQDLDYLCFFLVWRPPSILAGSKLEPSKKKTWIHGSMLSSDLVDPDLLSVSRRTANLVPAVANHTVKRYSLPAAH